MNNEKMGFKKAVRKQVKLKLALTGPSGAGKTYSALRMATGMGGKIAVIDTENGSASLYSDIFDFDTLNITPPFTSEKYIEAIELAEKSGYDTIIIDSLTHAWAGEGGLLDQKNQLDSRPKQNQWANWKPIDEKDSKLRNAYLHSSCHVIATMRSKMEYMQTEKNGEKKIEKVGLAPQQRDGIIYEFTTVFDVAMNNECEVSKDRSGIFAGKIFKITEETGKAYMKWMESGKPLVPEDLKQKSSLSGQQTQEVPTSAPPIQAPQAQSHNGEYRVPFGKKYKGKTINEIGVKAATEYMNYLKDSAKESGKEMSRDAQEFIGHVELAKLAESQNQDKQPEADVPY